MTDKVLCIYHANCADGLGAAWAVHKALGDNVEFVAGKYGDLIPSSIFERHEYEPDQQGEAICVKCGAQADEEFTNCVGRDVLIVDFSYPLSVLRAMAQEARSVLVLDHHKTAEEDLKPICGLITEKLPWDGKNSWLNKETWPDGMLELAVIFDQSRSGAGVTWDYLHPGVPRPRIIDLIEDRDLWKFKFGDESRAFHAVLASYDWTDLPGMFERLDGWLGLGTSNVISHGYSILRAQQQAVASAVAASRRTMRIAGHIVPVANVPSNMASDAGHLLCGSLDEQYNALLAFHEACPVPTTEQIIEWTTRYPQFANELRAHAAVARDWAAKGGMTADEPTKIELDRAFNRAIDLLMSKDPPTNGRFSATYYDGSDGKRHFSLRSPEGGADVGAIAKKQALLFNIVINPQGYVAGSWAGGGHEHAAGFDAPIGWEGE